MLHGDGVASADPITPESLQSKATTPKMCTHELANRHLHACSDRERGFKYCPGSGLSINVPVTNPTTPYAVSGTRSTAFHSPNPSDALSFEPSTVEAESYLREFKELKSPYFPIIVLSPGTDAQQLRDEKPFVWLCIMAITSKSTEQQKALGREIRLTLGREVLSEGKNNLDLLQGILLYVSWYVI